MYFQKTSLTLTASLLCLLLSPMIAFAQPELLYQDRGDRKEGVKGRAVGGETFSLISALVDYTEPTSILPERVTVRFFLHRQAEVFLTVRELDNNFFYWLDDVRPPEPWVPGFQNKFSWSTEPVLQQLNANMKMYELGVLARIKKRTPSAEEWVAPALLYHSQPPTVVTGYRFTLTTGADARVRCSLFPENESQELKTQVFRRVPGKRPFTFHWDASSAEAGPYRLVVTGFLLDTNERFHQVVHFYHQPRVQ